VKPWTVLVTGGRPGYIGSHMVQALGEAGESAVVIDNLSTGVFLISCRMASPLIIGDAGDETLVGQTSIAPAWHREHHSLSRAPSWCRIRCTIRWPYYRNNTIDDAAAF